MQPPPIDPMKLEALPPVPVVASAGAQAPTFLLRLLGTPGYTKIIVGLDGIQGEPSQSVQAAERDRIRALFPEAKVDVTVWRRTVP